ncbi:uncharacterized protein EKO05_0004158 [Ascochyta rabiei]|uniref:Uncharacterized protein n=1 Tax=Didymella rabiei TaxID=5454 RepID=A0A162Y160_DIDRA|nr:uncharacterized protein EKO05_0004158 [Ascochyta rabiei]KZM19779.1 hypothetical protein ST47_g9159 [Ascochyta rabiei]UPX13658.1 hypothetical protein EKO05_0004158 [Ascochyta rabiei]
MTSSHPVILCGKSEAIGAVVIENLKPEFEVIQFIQNVDAGKIQIPTLLRGEKPESSGSSLGSKNYARAPVAIFLGAAFDDRDIQELRKAAESTTKVPWLRPDTTKPAPPPGPEYGKAMVARIKETVKGLEGRTELKGNGDVVWF